ncbi:MAG: hypothetical protein JXR58_13830 [Bacteroidales bacterium]|nr:hypothetical protein [Bacteroidales bacterium]
MEKNTGNINPVWYYKLIFSAFFLFYFSNSSISQDVAQENYEEFKTYFTEINNDTLHIFPSMITDFSKCKIIPGSLIFQENELFTEDTVFAISCFSMDSANNYIAYNLAISRESKIGTYLIVFSVSENKFIYDVLTSYYQKMESTAEITRNTWILDSNNDKNLDIAVIEDIIDYEYPISGSENISGTIFRLYAYENGRFVNTDWPTNLLTKFELLK